MLSEQLRKKTFQRMPWQFGILDYKVKTNLKDQSNRLNQVTKWFN